MTILAKDLRPKALYVLTGLSVFHGISALFGGSMLLRNPTGAWLQMPPANLENTPFADYLMLGLILFCVLGVYPLVLAHGLRGKRSWRILARLEALTGIHWAWLASLSAGVALVIWIVVQGRMIGFDHPLQAIYLSLGLVLIWLTLLPAIRRYGAVPEQLRG